MNNPVLERNLLALQRVQPELARVLIRYGGDCKVSEDFEPFKDLDSDAKHRIHLAGFVEPSLVYEWCKSGREITLYCETLDEILAELGHFDLRQFLFIGALQFELGVWRYALVDMETTKLLFTPSYRRMAEWVKRVGHAAAEPNVIVANGTLFVDDTGDALVELGYCPLLIDVENLPLELWPAPGSLNIEFVVSINDRDGLEAFAQSLGARCLVWQIDPDLNEDRSEFPPGFFLGWYKPLNTVEEHRRYLPLASNPKRRFPSTFEPQKVSFVGTSMADTGRRYRTTFCDYLVARGVDARDADERIEAFSREICEGDAGFSRRRVCEQFPEIGTGIETNLSTRTHGVDTTMWLGEYLASRWRFHVLESLDSAIDVWGDTGWEELKGAHITFQGRCGHHAELNRVYGTSLINLDIGRVYQEEIVTMRVFDVLASQRLILSPHTPALVELFEPDREIVTYRSLEELNAKIRYYLEHPSEALEIAERGYQRVVKEHQIVHRLETLIDWSDQSALDR